MTQTEVQFTVPTTNNDGTPITETLSYKVYMDTVNPPVANYPVPAANVTAAVAGVVTVTFVQLGFTPVAGKTYWAAAVASDTDGVSTLSNEASFVYAKAPSAPTGFTVS